MAKRVILAVPQREYAAKLAEFLRGEEPNWDIAVYTHGSALRREIQDNRDADLLIGVPELLRESIMPGDKTGKVIALVEEKGDDTQEEWQEVAQFQPLPAILSSIRKAMSMGTAPSIRSGGHVLTVFSASGGTGKTTVALNAIRQAGERGLRTFYFNLEALNATSLLFGRGEPDSLSRLLYAMQAHSDQLEPALEQLCRHQPQLRTDFLDAPEHPGERLAMSTEALAELLGHLRRSGRYDLIVVDPDSGAGDWHRELMLLSDSIVWLTLDDAQSLLKNEKLLRYWHRHNENWLDKCIFVWNKAYGDGLVNRWPLPGGKPTARLPYIPQWKTVDQPGKYMSAPVFSGAIERLLQEIGFGSAVEAPKSESASRRTREEGNGGQRSYVRGTG
ncbi:hypothetical protein D7Z26_10440 [Cohnella endophytica]|uniref:AAA domain-containing protein n=1 Tax=Cohnella endophytica TaxID=2419778 RepID=A0A494XT75_9BACL|nr:hypothetical protein [Cohnella endophytica]RKP53810.1 hypothetical protein D7Z26_10440 [Cohnella endophytica]